MQFTVSSSFFPAEGKVKASCGHTTAVGRCVPGVLHSSKVNPLQSKPQPPEGNGQIPAGKRWDFPQWLSVPCQKYPSLPCRGWRWLPRAPWSWSHCPGRYQKWGPPGMALGMGPPFPHGDAPQLPPAQALFWAPEDAARVHHPLKPDWERSQMKAKACRLAFNHGYAWRLVFPKHPCYSNTPLIITAIGSQQLNPTGTTDIWCL